MPSRLISSPCVCYCRALSSRLRVGSSTSGARTSVSSFSETPSALNSAAGRTQSYTVLAIRSITRRSGRPGAWVAARPGATVQYGEVRYGFRWHLIRSRGHVNEVGQCKVGETCACVQEQQGSHRKTHKAGCWPAASGGRLRLAQRQAVRR